MQQVKLQRRLLNEYKAPLEGDYGHGGIGLAPDVFAEMTQVLTRAAHRLQPHEFQRAAFATFAPSERYDLRFPSLLATVQSDRHAGLPIGEPSTSGERAWRGTPTLVHWNGRSNAAPQLPPPPLTYGTWGTGLNRPYRITQLQLQVQHVLSADQLLTVSAAALHWSRCADVLTGAAERAEAAVRAAVSDVGKQRKSWMATAGRGIWVALTVAGPPPFGPIIGAVLRSVLCEDKWVNCIARAGEWLLQVQYPTDGKGHIDLSAKIDSRHRGIYAPSANPAGHLDIRLLKDMPAQGLPGFETIFTGKTKKSFDRFNKATLASLLELPAPPDRPGSMQATLVETCRSANGKLREAVRTMMRDYTASNDRAGALLDASWLMQQRALRAKLARCPAADRARFVDETVHEGAQLYLNTVAHYLMQGLYKQTGAPVLPSVDAKKAQVMFERVLFAHYLATQVEPSTFRPRGVAAPRAGSSPQALAARPQYGTEGFWAATYGTVKANVWSGALEARLRLLGITVQPSADTPRELFAMWKPPDPGGGPWPPVPYFERDEAARGRLAAWAISIVRRKEEALERDIRALLC